MNQSLKNLLLDIAPFPSTFTLDGIKEKAKRDREAQAAAQFRADLAEFQISVTKGLSVIDSRSTPYSSTLTVPDYLSNEVAVELARDLYSRFPDRVQFQYSGLSLEEWKLMWKDEKFPAATPRHFRIVF